MKIRTTAGSGCLVLGLVCLSALTAHAQTRVTGIEHQASKDRVRVVLRCDAPVQYVGGTATNPSRIFFDLKGTRPAARLAKESAVGDAIVERVRVALNRPGVTRMVLDLTRPAPYTATFLPNPPRLVIEVMREGTSAESAVLTKPSRPAAPAPSRSAPPPSRKGRMKATPPEPVASALLPPAPVVLSPEQMPPVAPQVTYRNGLLSIVAENSTLSDILHAVAAHTGATVDAPANLAGQRVAARLGPGTPRDVMADLLTGLDYIVVGASNDPDAIRSIIVSNSGPSVAGRAPAVAAPPPPPEPAEAAEPEPPAPQQPPQALPPGESSGKAPPQAKSPEELLEELRKLQEQQAKEPAR
jgi:AMIN domain-containing protein